MNLQEILKDTRGREMISQFKSYSHKDRCIYYNNLIEYINHNGIEEAYLQYQAIQNKRVKK